MIYRHVIKELEKYSFIDRIEYGTNFYIKLFYKVNGVEKTNSISRRANPVQLSNLIKKIRKVADKAIDPKFDSEMPVEIVKYEVK